MKPFAQLVKSYSDEELEKQKQKTVNAIQSAEKRMQSNHMLPVWRNALEIINNELENRK